MTLDDIKRLHKGSFKNAEKVKASFMCGCFYCENVFHPSEITSWTDGGETAFCPKCGIDSVLPDVTDKEILGEMNNFFFSHK